MWAEKIYSVLLLPPCKVDPMHMRDVRIKKKGKLERKLTGAFTKLSWEKWNEHWLPDVPWDITLRKYRS